MLWYEGPIFDMRVEGTTVVYTAPSMNDKLGEAGWNDFTFQLDQVVSGTTLTVVVETSPDELHWTPVTATPMVNGVSLSDGQTISGYCASVLRFTRLAITLGGVANPAARVRAWVAGRTLIGAGVTFGPRIFHQLMVDKTISSPNGTPAQTEGYDELLACADMVWVCVVVDSLGPNGAYLQIFLTESPDGEVWKLKDNNTQPEFRAAPTRLA